MLKYVFWLFVLLIIAIVYMVRNSGITGGQIEKAIYLVCGVGIAATLTIHYGLKTYKKRSYLNSPLATVDKMTGEEFERYLKAHFENLGYRVSLTPQSHDYGADLVCKKGRDVLLIQAKRYHSGKLVGIEAIQQICGAKAYYNGTKCMVVTNSYYSSAARELAKCNDVELWDRKNINEKLVLKGKAVKPQTA